MEAFVARQEWDEAAAAAVAAARQVRDQDVDLAGPMPALRRGVAKDRRISVEDAQMRHGRKSRSVLFDGYKRHVLRDLDTGLVPAVGITPANVPEASVTDDIEADLQAAGMRPGRAAHRPGLPVLGPGPRPRTGPGHLLQGLGGSPTPAAGSPRTSSPSHGRRAADLPRRGSHAVPARQDRTVPQEHCAACPLRQRCTASSTGARSVSIHPDEALLAELRQRQQTPEGREELRERVQVEHALAHVGHWQGRRARYLGTRKEPIRPAPLAVVHNLHHVIARQPDNGEYQLAA